MSLPDPASALVLSLRERHTAMTERAVAGIGVAAVDRQRLIGDLIQAGAVVPSGIDRDALRNVLFFWVSDQAGRGEVDRAAPPPGLLPYAAPEGTVAAGTALPEPAMEGTPGPTHPSADFAPEIGPQTEAATAQAAASPIQAAPPATLTPPAATGSAFAAAMVQPAGTLLRSTMQVAGAVASLLGPLTAPKPVPLSSSPVSPCVPSDAEGRRIVRLSALAREWRLTDAGRKRGYLIGDSNTLAEAARFASSDPEIAALVEASRAALNAHAARARLVVSCVTAAALLGLLAFATVLWRNADHRREQAEGEARRLLVSDTEHLAERTQIRDNARNAIDALQGGDLAPLKALLVQLGNAEPSELDQLRLHPEPVQPTAPAGVQATTPAAPAPAPVASLAGGPDCNGYLWLGTVGGDNRLAGQRDPTTLKPGDAAALVVRGDLRLLPGWPDGKADDDNRQVGLIPAGAQFRLLGAPMPSPMQPRQSWAGVTVPRAYCTRIFLQYVGSTEKRDAALAALRALNLQVPAAEHVASAKGLAEIRYFNAEDQPVAAQAAEALARFNGGAALHLVNLTSFPRKPSSGTIEAWLDVDRP